MGRVASCDGARGESPHDLEGVEERRVVDAEALVDGVEPEWIYKLEVGSPILDCGKAGPSLSRAAVSVVLTPSSLTREAAK